MIFDIKEAAAYLKVKESWLRYQIFRKNIPQLKMGRHIRFEAEALDKWLVKNRKPWSGGDHV